MLDIIGGAYLARNVDVLAMDGRLVVIGLQGGRAAEVSLAAVMAKRAHITGALLRARSAAQKAAIVAEAREHVWPLLESGAVVPVVDRVVPMPDAAEAHRVVESGEHVGKVLLAT